MKNPTLYRSFKATRNSRGFRREMHRYNLSKADARNRTLARVALVAWAFATVAAFVAGYSIKVWS